MVYVNRTFVPATGSRGQSLRRLHTPVPARPLSYGFKYIRHQVRGMINVARRDIGYDSVRFVLVRCQSRQTSRAQLNTSIRIRPRSSRGALNACPISIRRTAVQVEAPETGAPVKYKSCRPYRQRAAPLPAPVLTALARS